LIKETLQQEDIRNVNIYTPIVSIPNFIKQTLLDIKTQIAPKTAIVDDFKTLLSPIDWS
jgi:hypothetical protein